MTDPIRPDLQLSPHFDLAELCHSDVALRRRIPNLPGVWSIVEALRQLATCILEPIRAAHGPFSPTSGYRCPDLNAAIGGAPGSQHVMGEAADIRLPVLSVWELALWVERHLVFDQLILECATPGELRSGWVHVSYVPGHNRQQSLTFDGRRYLPGLRF